MSDSLGYQKGLADGYQNLGDSYYVVDSLYPAMINYLNSVSIYEQIDPTNGLAEAYGILSTLNYYVGRYEPSIKYRLKAIRTYDQLDQFDKICSPYIGLAYTYHRLGELDSAIYYNDIALSYTDSSNIYVCCMVFGHINHFRFIESGDTSVLDKSIEWYLRGLNSPEIDDYYTACINNDLVETYYLYGRKEMDRLAFYHLNQVIQSAEKSKDAFLISQ